MDPVSATPSHILLQRKQADDHEARPAKDGTAAASAFAAYGFGPLEEPKKDGAPKPVNGVGPMGNPLSAHSLSWVTDVQAASSTGTNTKA